MSNARIQFTLPQVAAATVWLAAVFSAAHYAFRIRLERSLVPFFVIAAGCVWLSIVVVVYLLIYQRERVRNSLVRGRLLATSASFLLLIGAAATASVGAVLVVLNSNWALSLPLLALSASLAATAFLMRSSHYSAARRRRRATAARQRLRQMLSDGRALLDEPLPDEAAFWRWQQQVARWRAECERLLAAWLPAREVSDVFAHSDVASVWFQRFSPEHEVLLGELDGWLDRLRVIVASGRWI